MLPLTEFQAKAKAWHYIASNRWCKQANVWTHAVHDTEFSGICPYSTPPPPTPTSHPYYLHTHSSLLYFIPLSLIKPCHTRSIIYIDDRDARCKFKWRVARLMREYSTQHKLIRGLGLFCWWQGIFGGRVANLLSNSIVQK